MWYSVRDVQELRRISIEIRKSVTRMLAAAGSGHLGSSLGLADIFTTLYFSHLVHDPDNPTWVDRDRVILSIGHVAPVMYATLAHCGYFPVEELLTLRKLGSRLQGHPGRDHGLPGLEISSGSLGQGLSVCVGLAIGARLDNKHHHIYCIMGDGELQEGSVWEAAMAAAHHKLDNLIAIIDRNGLQIDGRTSEVMEIEPLAEKWKAFGWSVISCDGHSITDINQSLKNSCTIKGKPVVILAQTIMCKGIPDIENDYRWHGKVPSQEQLEDFINELEKQ
jgi:transketolase